jgi:hypothetical protein
MALPVITPASTTTVVRLSASATAAEVSATQLPFNIAEYKTDQYFLSGAAEQVAYVYKMLGGDVLDIELTNQNVYSAYQAACMEYSYLVNIHQAKNSLPSMLGATTGTFDHLGHLLSGPTGSSVALKFPRFQAQLPRNVAKGFGASVGVGGDVPVYSASINLTSSVQDYDLQAAADIALSSSGHPELMGKRAVVTRVYYITPRAMWRFFAYYGGINVIGNMTTYGMYTDDSTFEVVPTWQNKLQAMMYEDSIYTRTSHHSYEIVDNKLRLYPVPAATDVSKMYFRFYIVPDAWQAGSTNDGIGGVNNLNTLPFENIPYTNINSIGKQWIRRYALALSKEMLSQIRGKFGGAIPSPGVTLTLNSSALASEADKEKTALREELVKVLDELTYAKITETQAGIAKNAAETMKYAPLPIFVGSFLLCLASQIPLVANILGC